LKARRTVSGIMSARRASQEYFVIGCTICSWFATSSKPSRPARPVWSVR
jgi:hypothetical protein